jgi:hypothetical protein
MCVLAPAALIDPALTWTALDDRHVVATLDRFDETVSATLTFDDDDRLVDFVSDDRSRSSSDGRSFTPQRWSTPLSEERDFDGRRVNAHGEARWHAPLPEGEFAYLDFELDAITYNADRAMLHLGSDPGCNGQPTEMRSTTNTSVSLGAMTPPAPDEP